MPAQPPDADQLCDKEAAFRKVFARLAGCGEAILELLTGFVSVFGLMSNEYGHDMLLN